MRYLISGPAISCATLALAVVAISPAAHAQVVTADPVVTEQPIGAVRTVRTVTTTRTVRPHGRRTTTTTTTTSMAAPSVAAAPPLYDYATPAPAPVVSPRYYDEPYYDDSYYDRPYDNEPLYDSAVTTAPPVVGSAASYYRYVYEPDRILVVDPSGLAVQVIPR
jgi:hypothetical protein